MKSLIKIDKPGGLKRLKLGGIQILETKEGSGGTFKGIDLQDGQTGTRLRIEMGPYSDLNIYTESEPNVKQVFRLTGEMATAKIEKDFDTKAEAEGFVTENSVQSPVITTLSVQVDD